MAAIKKTKSGSYTTRIYLGRDEKGKQIFKYVTKEDTKDLKRAVRDIETDIDNGNYSNMGNIRLSSWLDQWLELHRNRLSPSTYQSYDIYANHHFKPFYKALRLSQITDIHIKKYINEKLETLSNTTVRKHIFVFRKILQEALKDKSPAKYIEVPPPKMYKPHVVTDKEFSMIHEHFKGHKYEAVILLSAWCGLRRGEIFALKWNDIVGNTIRIDEAMSISEEGYVAKETKSHNGMRTIVIPEYIKNLLKKKQLNTRIFTGRPDNFTHVFSETMKRLNLPDIRFHDLRHYHASWLYNNQIPDKYVAERLGHDIQTLKKIYQHIDADRSIELDNKILNLMQIPSQK